MSKDIRILLITFLAICTLANEINPNYSFDDFMKDYSRTYEGKEKADHEAAFKTNFAELLRLKNEGKDVAINDRLDMTPKQKDDFFSYKPQTLGIAPSARPLSSNQLFASPSAFDWRTYNRTTPVKYQGNCGSCWSFAATAQYQSMLAIATNGTMYDLAEQYAFQCETRSFGCVGGYPYYALQLMRDTGIPLESAFPYSYYSIYSGICNSTNKVKLNQTVNNVSLSYFQNLTVEQLQQDLVSYGPITVGVYGSNSNFNNVGSTGLISCGPSSTVDHAVLLVGYNTTHWFVKNSWNTWWGHNGYGYITKNTSNDCNIRQYVNEMQVDFGYYPAPDPTLFNLTVTMTDSGGDGWNGNVLSVLQNGVVLGSFGASFTSGSSGSPITIGVRDNMEVQVVTGQLGTKSNEVGFTITAPNGTIIHQRTTGTSFEVITVFASFCPAGGCPPTLLLSVTMTDSFGDGWNGNILAIKQNDAVFGNFGVSFTTGVSSGPIFIPVPSGVLTQIVVSQLGTKTSQIGFTVKAPNGTTIHLRTSGNTFDISTIFATFCPLGVCPTTSTLIVTMTDSYGDGWNGNVLGIRQNGSVIGTFGAGFTSGSSSGPLLITVAADLLAQIFVVQVGTKTNEMGFVVRASSGIIVYQLNSGSFFDSTTVFSTFCPGGACPATFLLNITLSDSYGDGWNGNILAIKQNGTIVGTFGNGFTFGNSTGPVYLTVQGNLEAQVVVSVLGGYTNEVGFVIKVLNGTTVAQRLSGIRYSDGAALSSFCPAGGCPIPSTLNLTINMVDYWTYGSGWNGAVVAIKQNNAVVGTFGSTFSSSYTTSPVYIVVQGNVQVQVVSISLPYNNSWYCYMVGFSIKAPNGTTIYMRNASTLSLQYFLEGSIFSTFCPVGGCSKTNSNTTYYLLMYDTYNDGWQGNVLAFKVNDTILYTFALPSGFVNAITPYSFPKGQQINVVVYALGNYSNQVYFQLFDNTGASVVKRWGSKFNANTVLISFCVECLKTNLGLQVLSDGTTVNTQERTVEEVESVPTSTKTSDEIENEASSKAEIRPYLIALCVVSSLLVISIGLLFVGFFKLRRKQNGDQSCKSVPSGENNEAIRSMESAESANKQSDSGNVEI